MRIRDLLLNAATPLKGKNKTKEMLIGTSVSIFVTLLFLCTLTTQQAEAKSFSDVNTEHWAYSTIQQISEKGLVSGYPTGSFKPSKNVTRAEFAAMLVRTIPTDQRVAEPFTDVSTSFWGKSAIEQGIALGFIDPSDYKDNKFEPNKAMTRAELSKWMANGLSAMNSDYGQVVDTLANSTSTLIPIPETYKGGVKPSDLPYIGVMLGTEIMSGFTDSTFRPNENTTRAEVSAILIRFLMVLKQDPSSFKGLNELVEVAETGSNITTASNYKYSHNTSFKDVIDKPFSYKNNLGVAKLKRMIVVDANLYSEVDNSIYGKMFLGKDGFFLEKETLKIFVEQEFTPYQSGIKRLAFSQGTQNAFFGSNLSSESRIDLFGIKALPREEFSSYIIKGQPLRVWMERTYRKEVGDMYSLTTDDNSSFYIKYQ